MPRTWVTVVAATLLLLATAMVFHKSRRDDDSGDGSEHRGRSALDNKRDRLAARPGNHRGGPAFDDDSDSGSIDAAVTRARERAAARTGSQPDATGDAAADNQVEAGADGTTDDAGGAAPGAHPKKGTTTGAGAGTEQAAAGSAANGSATPGADDDPNAPAVSFKFDKSTMPDKGDAAPIVESGVTMDQNGAHFSEGAQFAIPHVDGMTGTAGTISFSVVPDWSGSETSNASMFQWRTGTFENRIQIFKNGPFLRFIFCDNTGVESGVGTDISTWKPGDAHSVVATWGDGITGLYVDGGSVGYKEYNGELQVPVGTTPMIGSDFNGGAGGTRGSIRNLQYIPRALSADEVAALAAQSH